ncbi:cholesterol 24-hydroxylase-like isoform X2 [Lineus longissimus]|uniref:cholesterol 24-hydroxylase-like isoform X2 n=1 Tax=Lineus longissimus TaxID=88925 RepID=UPI00315DF353
MTYITRAYPSRSFKLPTMFWLYLSVPFLAIFAIFMLYVLYILYIRYVKFGHIPRAPLKYSFTSFFLGHATVLIDTADDWRKKIRVWGEWSRDHGDFFGFFVFHNAIMITDNHIVAKQLMTSKKYLKNEEGYKDMMNVFGRRLIGNGLLTDVDHEHWYRKRQLLNPAFHKLALKDLMDEFNLGADCMVSKLLSLADGETTVSLLDIVNRTALDVIGRTAFGLDIDSLNNNKSPFPTSIRLALQGVTSGYKEPFCQYNPWKRKYVMDVRNACEFLRSFGRKIINERLALVEDGVDLPNDILTNILKSTKVDPSVTLEELVDDFVTFFVAGQETTANTIAFLLQEVGKRPEVLMRLVEEVDEVIGQKRHIIYDDLAKLEYMNLCLKEILRMYPVATATIRGTTEETVIAGFKIPAETSIMVSFGNIHHKECYFKDPEEFKPERFMDESQREYFTYMPFSAGMRNCIGQNFAMIESRVVLCKLLQTFKYTLLPNQSDKVTEATTIKPSSGVMATLQLRDD